MAREEISDEDLAKFLPPKEDSKPKQKRRTTKKKVAAPEPSGHFPSARAASITITFKDRDPAFQFYGRIDHRMISNVYAALPQEYGMFLNDLHIQDRRKRRQEQVT